MTSMLPRRRLGLQGLEVSALGLGCMGMSEFYGPADEALNLKVLHHALDRGVNFLDTADMYGVGANERLLSSVLRERRSEIVLATKFGIVRGPNGERLGISGRPEYVRSACEASLERLGVEQIDLYYQHRVDPNVPIEETVGAMAELVKSGKVRYLGLSEAGAKTLRRASAVHPISALQSEYSLWSRDLGDHILPTCGELGIGVVAYSPLGRGFLTGAFQSPAALGDGDNRLSSPRFVGENFKRNLRLLEPVKAIASELGHTPAQIALAWLLQHPAGIVPIPGTRRIERLDENLGAAQVKLREADRKTLDALLVSHEVAGLRYPDAGMAAVNL
ncbi:aldo/keto reductase [Hydrocarboniphaga effusa]|uniref:aldo/keto reductase n=1 Tax=Hydrocarboniphaga effusa TaxID=243629 RepID=UPI0035B041F4